MSRLNLRKGFTLIELMIVVAVIGVLAAIAVPSFIAYRDKSRVASAVGTSGSIRAAIASYAADSDGNLFPLDGAVSDWDTLLSITEANGGTLKTTATLQGMSLASYDATPQAGDIDGEDYVFVFYTIGVPATMDGAQIEVRPSGIERQTLGGS